MRTWSTSSRGDTETPHATAASTTTMPSTTARRRRRRVASRGAGARRRGGGPTAAGRLGRDSARVLTRPLPRDRRRRSRPCAARGRGRCRWRRAPAAGPRPRARARRRRWRPRSAWKKLACLADTTAPPTRRPLSPSESMSRPAESPGGLANTEPALEPPGWCSRRHRTTSATSPRSRRRSPRRSGRSRR